MMLMIFMNWVIEIGCFFPDVYEQSGLPYGLHIVVHVVYHGIPVVNLSPIQLPRIAKERLLQR